MPLRKRIRDGIYRSPSAKTGISFSFSVLAGIFSNTFVSDISAPDGFNWGKFYASVSFWILLVICALMYFFHRYMYSFESDIEAFRDDEYCVAYARSQLIPAQVEAYKAAISRGEVQQFDEAMRIIKDALK